MYFVAVRGKDYSSGHMKVFKTDGFVGSDRLVKNCLEVMYNIRDKRNKLISLMF